MVKKQIDDIKTCKNCGGIIDKNIKRYSIRKFCSYKCLALYRNKKHRGKSLIKRKIKRFEILKRDNFRCVYCGKSSIEDCVKLEIDHLEPESTTKNNLESESQDNLVTSCYDCNQEKSKNILTKEQVMRIKEIIKNRV